MHTYNLNVQNFELCLKYDGLSVKNICSNLLQKRANIQYVTNTLVVKN